MLIAEQCVALYLVQIALPFSARGILFTKELCPQAANVACTGEYAITQKDIDDGSVLNVGTVSCVDSEEKPIVENDGSKVDLLGTARVSLGEHSPAVGSEIGYVCIQSPFSPLVHQIA